jgi:hypothetical protein
MLVVLMPPFLGLAAGVAAYAGGECVAALRDIARNSFRA